MLNGKINYEKVFLNGKETYHVGDYVSFQLTNGTKGEGTINFIGTAHFTLTEPLTKGCCLCLLMGIPFSEVEEIHKCKNTHGKWVMVESNPWGYGDYTERFPTFEEAVARAKEIVLDEAATETREYESELGVRISVDEEAKTAHFELHSFRDDGVCCIDIRGEEEEK